MERKNQKAQSVLDRGIFWFYEWALKYVPLAIMLAHWYGVFDFHSNPREILVCIKENESCIAYLYCMTYVFPVVMMMPASYFYQLCWVYRIPFLYAVGVNAIRLFYGSWFITNEMYDADVILIVTICMLYVYALAVKQCWRMGRLFIKRGVNRGNPRQTKLKACRGLFLVWHVHNFVVLWPSSLAMARNSRNLSRLRVMAEPVEGMTVPSSSI